MTTTDRTPDERAARRAGDLRAVVDTLLDPWVLLEPVEDDGVVVDYRYADANEAAGRDLGIPVSELVGSLLLAGLPEGSRAVVRVAASTAFAAEAPVVLDAFPLPLSAMGLRDRVYDIRGVRIDGRMSVTWRDVTDRVRKASALADSEARYRLLAENASDVVYQVGDDGRVSWVSPSITALLGWRPAEVIDRWAPEFVHPDDVERAERARRAVMRGDVDSDDPLFLRYLRKDGGWRWMSVRARPTRSTAGDVHGAVVALLDHQAAHEAEQRLVASEANYRSLAENASDVILILGRDGEIRWASPSATATLGRSPEGLVGQAALDLIHPDELPLVRARARSAMEGESIPPTEARYLHAVGDYRWGSFAASLRDGSAGTEWLIALRDIDTEVKARQALTSSREVLRGTIDTLIDPWVLLVAVRDEIGRVVDFEYADANDAACAANGLPREQLLGTRLLDLFPQHEPEGLLAMYAQVVETGTPLVLDDYPFVNPRTGGAERRFDNRAVRVGDGISFTWRDVTERYEARQELTRLARFDILTGLPNRAHVLDRMAELFARRRPDDDLAAVLFCDLDHFKSINDAHLHAAGDAVLQAVAARLVAAVRPRDVVGRLGGDEFVVVLDGVRDADEAQGVAERIRASVAQPIALPDRVLRVRMSIGVSLLRGGTAPDVALTRSDDAMYRAKALGRDRAVVLAPED